MLIYIWKTLCTLSKHLPNSTSVQYPLSPCIVKIRWSEEKKGPKNGLDEGKPPVSAIHSSWKHQYLAKERLISVVVATPPH